MVDTRDNIRRTSDHDFRFEAVLLRSQFDANKHVTSLAKATQLLKDGEELYFINQGFYTFEHAACHGVNSVLLIKDSKQ